jgi:hypothetical protein
VSVLVWGIIVLKNKTVPENELIKLGFKIIIMAAENEIAIDLGDRIRPWVHERYKNSEYSLNSIPFQLTNHSLNPNVGALFIGQGNEIYSGTEREDWSESLNSRMSRIQNYLAQVFNISSIETLILYVESGYGKTSIKHIKANEFKETILILFKQNDNITPNVKFIISQY